MFKIKTYNKISVKGLERFPRGSYEVGSDIGSPDAVLLRSQKLQGVEVPASLVAVARAGAGTNNVPVADYSKLGIVVFNTPGCQCQCGERAGHGRHVARHTRYFARHGVCKYID
jgi:D-3-phosphoglycerate dehydrogenase